MSKKEQLDQVAQRVASCQKCSLYKTATNPVPGNGDPDGELLFIGEGPGFWEDQKGIPFCGAAGKLLDELLTSINLDREKVFVANILKHRPPENREPMPDEIEACKEYLDDQIKIIAPKAIVTLGCFSMMKFFPYGKIS
ncbi:uracil-DNA glycosylase, partial [Candidatus Shapirobacteria bacterium CG09_land_8_20_14_0_10_39_12]